MPLQKISLLLESINSTKFFTPIHRAIRPLLELTSFVRELRAEVDTLDVAVKCALSGLLSCLECGILRFDTSPTFIAAIRESLSGVETRS
jgi:hypothetical protein